MNRRLAPVVFSALLSTATAQAGDVYVQTNLVSNNQSVVQAQQTDANLINPWGLSYAAGGPLWVSNQGTGTSTVYALNGTTSSPSLLTVGVPNLGLAPPSGDNGPTGQVSTLAPGITTTSSDFQVGGSRAIFIFDNLDGSISAWRGGLSSAAIETTINGASFTGLAIGNTSSGAAQIYAADQNSNNVYVFNSSFQKIGSLVDPNLPAGFTAFNVQNIGGTLFVTYANPNNPLGGIIDEYTTDGTFIKRLIDDPNGTHLDTPWGVAVAPTGWGQFGGDLLVGNNDGDGTINAYSLSGAWEGQLTLGNGQAFTEGELWGMTFGGGNSKDGSADVLYFAAGLDGAANGLIGSISLASVPEPSSLLLGLIAMSVLTGGLTMSRRRRA
jgi:uncharacterized protein (TIGR03118 family)